MIIEELYWRLGWVWAYCSAHWLDFVMALIGLYVLWLIVSAAVAWLERIHGLLGRVQQLEQDNVPMRISAFVRRELTGAKDELRDMAVAQHREMAAHVRNCTYEANAALQAAKDMHEAVLAAVRPDDSWTPDPTAGDAASADVQRVKAKLWRKK